MSTSAKARPVIFFDGVCNLCNSWVQFIIRHDKQKKFLFAPLQSNAGRKALADTQAEGTNAPDSIILLHNGVYTTRSAAVLHIARLLGGIWALLYAGMIVPAAFRDAIYKIVARNRYKWFGRRNECMLPAKELTDRFVVE